MNERTRCVASREFMDKVSGERKSTECRTDQREASVHGKRRDRNLFPTVHHVDPSRRFGASSRRRRPIGQPCKNTVGRVWVRLPTVGRFRASGIAQDHKLFVNFYAGSASGAPCVSHVDMNVLDPHSTQERADQKPLP